MRCSKELFLYVMNEAKLEGPIIARVKFMVK